MKALALSDFTEGQDFEVSVGEERYEFVLESASELPSSIRPQGGFSLTFRGPYEPIVPQGTYRFRNERLDCEIFVVPVGRDDGGTIYEAIFN